MKRQTFSIFVTIFMIVTACGGSSTDSATSTTETISVTEVSETEEVASEEVVTEEFTGSLEEELAQIMPTGDEEFLFGVVDSEETALCIAAEVIENLGESKLVELGVIGGPFDPETIEDEALILGIADAVEECGDMETVLETVSLLIGGELPDLSCVNSVLEGGLLRDLLIAAITGNEEASEDVVFAEIISGCPEFLTAMISPLFGESGAECIASNMDLEVLIRQFVSNTALADEDFVNLLPWEDCPDLLLGTLAPFFEDDYALTSCIIETVGQDVILASMMSNEDDDELYTDAYFTCMFGGCDEESCDILWVPFEYEGAWSYDGQQGFIDGCVFIVNLIPELSLYSPIDFCGCILGDMMKDVDEMEYYIAMDQDGRDAAAEPYFARCMF